MSKSSSNVTCWTFYTDDKYKQAAERLRRSCERFGLAFRADAGPDLGSWRLNCNQKPALLLKAFDELEGPVVCLDADCIIHRRPNVFLEAASDVDAIIYGGGIPAGRRYVPSGVAYFGRTKLARFLIDTWVEFCASRKNKADPQLKRACVRAVEHGAKIENLPGNYLKPYWFNKACVKRPEDIFISCNERMTEHADGLYDRKRRRKDPLTPDHAL